MSASKSRLEHGRASFDRRAWGDAFEALARAETEGDGPLDPDDLERLAWSAGLRGNDEAFLGALERLHNACVEADRRRAARAAFWLGFRLMDLGGAAGSGWLTRAARLLENEEPCAEHGYLLLAEVAGHLASHDDVAAEKAAREAARIGERCRDRDLVALARHLEGHALLRQGRVEAGLAVLDEVMLTVTSDELSPLVTGIVYCNVIVCCSEVYAFERTREWTAALTRWCDEQPQLVNFTGICVVRRAEIMQLGGAWREAIDEIRKICERTNIADPEVFGDACYQQAELFRLRGEIAEAEKAYRMASENGCEPQPGLALLRMLQGQRESAVSTIRRALSTTTVKWRRARLLPAFIEIVLAAGGLDEARTACVELEEIARELGTEIIAAIAAHARGAVTIAEGDPRGATEPLRHAFGVWNRAGAPYIAARIRVLLGRAFFALGDRDGAELERDGARKVFEELGAAPDLAALDADDEEPASTGGAVGAHGLSKRELEVLRLLASGKTNKAIGKELFVSERTVDRHVSNIFTKIGVGTRSAATAFAYKNKLV